MLKETTLELSDSKPLKLKRLGIYEIALVKGKGNYCAVLINLDTSKLIAILSGLTQEIIKENLIKWGTEVLEQIEQISRDFCIGYKTSLLSDGLMK